MTRYECTCGYSCYDEIGGAQSSIKCPECQGVAVRLTKSKPNMDTDTVKLPPYVDLREGKDFRRESPTNSGNGLQKCEYCGDCANCDERCMLSSLPR